MKAEIIEKLALIEKAENIRILYACESGSRGWQFPSPDSDYDVRFIYVHPLQRYLSVTAPAEHLSFPIISELDVYGWDLRKVLKLMGRSNTTPFEWLQSPIIYRGAPGFREALWALSDQFFDKRYHMHHYLGIVKKLLEIDNGDISIKRLFYVLRSLLSAQWCLEKNEVAPLTIYALMVLLPQELQQQVNELIALKALSAEHFKVQIPASLLSFIQTTTVYCVEQARALDKSLFEMDRLDHFFMQTINAYDYSRYEAAGIVAV